MEEELQGKQIENTRFSNMLKHNGIDIISTTNSIAIDDNKDLFENFNYNIELAVYKEYSNAYVDTKKVKVYTFLDGSANILFNNRFYKNKEVNIVSKQEFIQKFYKNDLSIICKENSKTLLSVKVYLPCLIIKLYNWIILMVVRQRQLIVYLYHSITIFKTTKNLSLLLLAADIFSK